MLLMFYTAELQLNFEQFSTTFVLSVNNIKSHMNIVISKNMYKFKTVTPLESVVAKLQ